MAKTNRTTLTSNDQDFGQVADPNKLETMITHAYDTIDGNDTEANNHKTAVTLDHPDSSVTTAKIAALAVTTAKIADLNVTTGKIADQSITTGKITDLNVTTAKIADRNVTTAKLAASSVTQEKMSANSVGTSQIIDANITTPKIADAGVTTAKIADGNVTTAKLASGSVTIDKLDSNISDSTNLEVVNARVDPIDNVTYDTLKARIDKKSEQIGVLSSLSTQEKSSLVGAINEHNNQIVSLSGNLETVSSHLAEKVHQGEVHGLRATSGKLEYFDGTEWKTVSGGLPVGNVSNFTAQAGNTQVTLTWKDPTDVLLDGATLARWKGTKILRKVGSYPANENDGVLVVDSGVRNQYSTTGFIDVALTNDTTYYYSAFPYTDEDIYDQKSDAQATPQAVQIYGVKIDTTNSNPSTAVTYTDNAVGFTPASGNNGSFSYGSWQDKFPFNQIKPCVLKPDLTVNYYLNPNDYTKKLDGTAADITSGNDGDVMVEFPKLWWKFETIGTDLYVRYADAQVDATWKCLAHNRGVTEKDKVYISAYLGNTISSKLRSLSGKTPTVLQTIGTFRTEAQANGVGFDQMAYFQLLMLQVLFIVMFKSRDSQTALGRGYVDGNTAAIATGGANTKGLFYGETTGKQQNKFCGIEDFWGNVFYWIDGFFSDASRNMLIGTQSFNDTGSGYTNYGQGATADIGGYISDVQGGTETGFVIKASAGSATTHYTDYGYLYASRLPGFGGGWAGADGAGAFRLSVYNSATHSSSNVGARLLAL